MRGNLVLLGLLGAVSLTQSWLLGLTDLCCGGVQAQCRANCNTQVSIQSGEIVVNLLPGQECGSQCSGECGVFRRRCGPYPCSASSSSCSTTTSPTTTSSCSSTSTCSDGSSGCSSGLICYDGRTLLNINCCGQAANFCLTQAANNPTVTVTCP